jgi:inorganic pyrophosphatase
MQEPVQALSILHARPIGMMHMVDEGQNDEKIICVHLDDPEYRSYKHFDELPEHRLTELQRFFSRLRGAGGQRGRCGTFLQPGGGRRDRPARDGSLREAFRPDGLAAGNERTKEA